MVNCVGDHELQVHHGGEIVDSKEGNRRRPEFRFELGNLREL